MKLIEDKKGLYQMIDALSGASILYADWETTGFDPYTEKGVMIQLWDGCGEVYILDMRRIRAPRYLGKMLGPILDQATLVFHNGKFDLQWFSLTISLPLNSRDRGLRLWDCMIAEQYLKGYGLSDAKNHGTNFRLSTLAAERGIQMSKEERSWFIGLDKRPEEWNAPFPQTQLDYAELDVQAMKPIYEDQVQRLTERGMMEAMKVEMWATLALTHIELSGVQIDVPAWRAFIKEKEEEALKLYDQVYSVLALPLLVEQTKRYDATCATYAGWRSALNTEEQILKAAWGNRGTGWGKFKIAGLQAWRETHPEPKKPPKELPTPNLGSTQQLKEALHLQGIDVPSTKKEVLEELADEFDILHLFLSWRKAKKFSESFGEKLLSKINPVTGRLHPGYNQIGASSGRMSSVRPNFQQIPSKGDDGKRLRGCVIAPPGRKILVADYSGQELLILSDLSGDERMLDYIGSGVDLHGETARIMFGLTTAQNPKTHEVAPGISARSAAKTINFGIAYGMSAFKLSRDLGVSKERGEELMNSWYNTYPQAKAWLDKQGKYTREHLNSPTVTGWVRRFDPLGPEPCRPPRRSNKEAWKAYYAACKEREILLRRLTRQGMNTPIQGAAAGMTKKALGLLFSRLFVYNSKCGTEQSINIIAVVHDEIVVEAPEELAEEVAALLAECMDEAAKSILHNVRVPPTEVKISGCWSK